MIDIKLIKSKEVVDFIISCSENFTIEYLGNGRRIRLDMKYPILQEELDDVCKVDNRLSNSMGELYLRVK